MTKILVTGGAGYIGSHTVESLIDRGYEVVVYDNLCAGHRQAVHAQAEFVEGDLLDMERLNKLFDAHQFDGVMHFASHILVGESMQRPFRYLRDNVLAGTNLLEAVTSHGVGRFILSSTANLFDRPERVPIDETEAVIPGSVYGESKAITERMLYWMDRVYGLKYGCLRYFNACGAHPNGHIGEDHKPESHLIPLILQVALGQRDSIAVFGTDYETSDGTCIRDYVHVLDLASAHVLAFEALVDGQSRYYNLGNGLGYSVLEVIEMAREVTGHPIPVTYSERRAGDAAVLVADSTRVKQELGWQPQYADLRPIMESAWRWHSTHPQGYGDR